MQYCEPQERILVSKQSLQGHREMIQLSKYCSEQLFCMVAKQRDGTKCEYRLEIERRSKSKVARAVKSRGEYAGDFLLYNKYRMIHKHGGRLLSNIEFSPGLDLGCYIGQDLALLLLDSDVAGKSIVQLVVGGELQDIKVQLTAIKAPAFIINTHTAIVFLAIGEFQPIEFLDVERCTDFHVI